LPGEMQLLMQTALLPHAASDACYGKMCFKRRHCLNRIIPLETYFLISLKVKKRHPLADL
ncbi:MAG: hypothetical protein ACQETR_08925, partial [Thermodesulfobacteriota bacterium]